MSLSPLKVTCNLASPLAGEAPQLDSILSYELAFRLGFANKITRDQNLDESANMPIPISKKHNGKLWIWKTSDPIYDKSNMNIIRYTSRFPLEDALMFFESNRKSILTASGPYKMQYKALNIFYVNTIVWFVHGDRKEINKLLKKITSIGKNRGMGFGRTVSWEIEHIEEDYSIYANKYLMKTLPLEMLDKDALGYRISYGGYKPPYWHPDNYIEIAIPC